MNSINARKQPAENPITEEEKQRIQKAKECGLLFRESFKEEVEGRIPGSHRGYFYTLKNGIYVEEKPCDIEIAHDLVTPAESLLHKYQHGELERIMEKLGPEFGVVPFFKFDAETLTPNMIGISDMGMLARANPGLNYFLILSERLGLVYKKVTEGDGNLFRVQHYGIHIAEGLDKQELEKIEKKQKELYQRLS